MRLTDEQIAIQLDGLSGWTRDGDAIRKSYRLASFPAALVFVGAVGHLAEATDHHPDILIEYRTVTLTLSTHSAGGLTEKDFDLAARIDALSFRE